MKNLHFYRTCLSRGLQLIPRQNQPLWLRGISSPRHTAPAARRAAPLCTSAARRLATTRHLTSAGPPAEGSAEQPTDTPAHHEELHVEQEADSNLPPSTDPHPPSSTLPPADDLEALHAHILRTRLPLHGMEYHEQLQKKNRKSGIFMSHFKTHLKDARAPEVPFSQLMYPGLPCPLLSIEPLSSEDPRRHTDFFLVGTGADGAVVVGPEVNTRGGWVCVPPHPALTRPEHLSACEHFRAYVAESGHGPFQHIRRPEGLWRSVTLRSNARGELVLVANLHSSNLSTELETELQHSMLHYFTEGPGAECGVHALYFNKYAHSDAYLSSSPSLLWGRPYLHYSFMGITYSAGPLTPLPSSLEAERRLVECVRRLAEVGERSTLLEVGFGHGLLSLALSGVTRGVSGVSTRRTCVADARRNANAPNAAFEYGRPAEMLTRALAVSPAPEDLVAVVHTRGRAMDGSLVAALAESPADRVLLLHPTSAALDCSAADAGLLASAAALCRTPHLSPSRPRPRPLAPRLAFAVDSAPGANDLTMGVLLQRL